jgi:redox-sensing transcriptional repressor
MISEKTIERISRYRRLLYNIRHDPTPNIYSHQLAAMSHITPAQVRRDLMLIGVTGSPSRGYGVTDLIDGINRILDAPQQQNIALVGLGNLGRAILSYFPQRTPSLVIAAAFDTNPRETNRVIHGCRTYSMDVFEQVVQANGISVGIITVPAEVAQKTADLMVNAGIRGILNFAPVPIRAPAFVYIENLDVTMYLEKVAYFQRQSGK